MKIRLLFIFLFLITGCDSEETSTTIIDQTINKEKYSNCLAESLGFLAEAGGISDGDIEKAEKECKEKILLSIKM